MRATRCPRRRKNPPDRPSTAGKHRPCEPEQRREMNMKLAWSAAVLSLFAFLGPTERAALAADVPIAVLGIEATDAPDALATGLTDALRQRVTASKGYRLVPGRDLV